MTYGELKRLNRAIHKRKRRELLIGFLSNFAIFLFLFGLFLYAIIIGEAIFYSLIKF